MRAALISDVHANLVALRAVLAEIDGQGVELVLNAGDMIGYYPFPSEVISTLRRRKVLSIRGNHERAVLSTVTDRMNPMASAGIHWTAAHLSEEDLSYLRRLHDSVDLTLGPTRASMHHGSPLDEDEYVYERDADASLLGSCGCRLLILGHTHTPFVVHTEKGVIVNPGSVGQPRDGDPRASYMMFDSSSGNIQHYRVDYDIGEVVKAVEKAGLPSSVGRRLWSGY